MRVLLFFLLICAPSIALASPDTPSLPMKVYGTVLGSGEVGAYVGDSLLVSQSVTDGTLGYAPHLFLIPGTVPDGTTVVLKSGVHELTRFAFEGGASHEVALTIPEDTPSAVAAAVMLFGDTVTATASHVATLAQGVDTFVTQSIEVVSRAALGGFALFGGADETPQTVTAAIDEEGFATYTGDERSENRLLAAAGAALPPGAWLWGAGAMGLLGVLSLAVMRFRA